MRVYHRGKASATNRSQQGDKLAKKEQQDRSTSLKKLHLHIIRDATSFKGFYPLLLSHKFLFSELEELSVNLNALECIGSDIGPNYEEFYAHFGGLKMFRVRADLGTIGTILGSAKLFGESYWKDLWPRGGKMPFPKLEELVFDGVQIEDLSWRRTADNDWKKFVKVRTREGWKGSGKELGNGYRFMWKLDAGS